MPSDRASGSSRSSDNRTEGRIQSRKFQIAFMRPRGGYTSGGFWVG